MASRVAIRAARRSRNWRAWASCLYSRCSSLRWRCRNQAVRSFSFCRRRAIRWRARFVACPALAGVSVLKLRQAAAQVTHRGLAVAQLPLGRVNLRLGRFPLVPILGAFAVMLLNGFSWALLGAVVAFVAFNVFQLTVVRPHGCTHCKKRYACPGSAAQ